MAQDRVDLSICSRLRSQRVSSSVTGTVTGIKGVLRRFEEALSPVDSYSWTNMKILSCSPTLIRLATRPRGSPQAVVVTMGNHLIGHWSEVQSDVASSGEAELNAARGLPELIGIIELELHGENIASGSSLSRAREKASSRGRAQER